MISYIQQMVFMVLDGATIKLLKVLTIFRVACSYPKRIIISLWMDASDGI